MKKSFIIIAVLAAVGIGAYYAIINKGSSGNSIDNSQTNTPSAVSSESGAPDSNIELQTAPTNASSVPKNSSAEKPSTFSINIKNFNFTPSSLKIKTGAKVTWINSDNVAHTVTSDSGDLLNSSTISPGESFSFTFTDSGTVKYHCAIHPTMKGGIIVEN